MPNAIIAAGMVISYWGCPFATTIIPRDGGRQHRGRGNTRGHRGGHRGGRRGGRGGPQQPVGAARVAWGPDALGSRYARKMLCASPSALS